MGVKEVVVILKIPKTGLRTLACSVAQRRAEGYRFCNELAAQDKQGQAAMASQAELKIMRGS